jgi:hypothetical protein
MKVISKDKCLQAVKKNNPQSLGVKRQNFYAKYEEFGLQIRLALTFFVNR